jgi:hypothetical protein
MVTLTRYIREYDTKLQIWWRNVYNMTTVKSYQAMTYVISGTKRLFKEGAYKNRQSTAPVSPQGSRATGA